ncbi:hypothetical protein Daura_48445 [Dactylosporangium aurantiacum]|uniref:Uncharacterized protein n=1 Tax=Dactylosporangium aurantiacum TaxID=35754 RepID=A0A9Q9IHE8_9ACTN|nr:hypothetical protein [Dactylosporangium aurantiacum]MDG6109591.1 hypothetical protein [Dactylosporangium aurantiacum]UWZ54215.1 hypothetical protein Daura_48445 [Dactylosporangium aurantiacum]
MTRTPAARPTPRRRDRSRRPSGRRTVITTAARPGTTPAIPIAAATAVAAVRPGAAP